MQAKEYRTIDRVAAHWPAGAWDDEPDKVQWPNAATKLPCLAVRNHMGAWCGYVGVTAGHPDFGKYFGDLDYSVHGGLTFAAFCQPHGNEARDICHVPEPGEPDRVYWFGFDCAHGGDKMPLDIVCGPAFYLLRGHCTYKTLAYVKGQCRILAIQLAEAAAVRA